MFNTTEIALIQNVMNGTVDVTSYAYRIAIKGTVVDGVATLICTLMAILATYWMLRRVDRYIANIEDQCEKDECDFWKWPVLLVVLIIFSIATQLMFHDTILYILSPEYVVVSKILSTGICIIK